jgi:hypothetical protein
MFLAAITLFVAVVIGLRHLPNNFTTVPEPPEFADPGRQEVVSVYTDVARKTLLEKWGKAGWKVVIVEHNQIVLEKQ